MANTELIFVSGKGGTGKSAVAAAIAISRARTGQSVLAIDMGVGAGLAAHLRRGALSYKPTEVRPGLFAMEMDRARALDEYIKLQIRAPQGIPTRQLSAALSVLAETAPGVREIISIGKPMHEVWRGAWDAVIVDAQSLGQFQSYIDAPATISGLVPTGTVRRQADKLAVTLRDPNTTTVILVSTPAELPVNETSEAVVHLTAEHRVPRPKVVMNRVLPESGLAEGDLGALPAGPWHDAASHQLALEEEQDHWLGALRADRSLPYLRGVFTPEEVALHLADDLEEP